MWDKIIYRIFLGCLITVLVSATSLFGIRTVKTIKEEMKGNGRNSR